MKKEKPIRIYTTAPKRRSNGTSRDKRPKRQIDGEPQAGEGIGYLEVLLRKYFERRPDPQLLQDHVDTQMAAYEEALRKKQQQDQAAADEEGFQTARSSRKATLNPIAITASVVKKPKVVDDFYKFQLRKKLANQKLLTGSTLNRDQQILSVLKASRIL